MVEQPTKPAPTNDWWSAKIKNPHADNLFSYPFTLKTINSGLVVTYIPWGVIDDIMPVTVGVTGLSASAANVSDFSDWTVTMDWTNATHNFQATAGIGMPFLYFTKNPLKAEPHYGTACFVFVRHGFDRQHKIKTEIKCSPKRN